MAHTIWFMEGLSSQRDIIQSINQYPNIKGVDITVIASHSKPRNEILSQADYALLEPQEDKQRLPFIAAVVKQFGIHAIHAGRNCLWFEAHRQAIESLSVTLTTGTTRIEQLELAEDKVAFARFMEEQGLPVVPSLHVGSAAELQHLLADPPFATRSLCVKPVRGIYGMGFWRFDTQVSPMAAFTHPDSRKVNPHLYLNALRELPTFEPLVLMPYLPGPEHSIDMLVERGKVLAAVARRKEGALQYLENTGAAYELGKACAAAMQADGLVNVQTRDSEAGEPVLLEINMRPSGGIGYTRHSGVNLPALFALRQLELISQQEAINEGLNTFSPAVVRSLTDVVSYNPTLTNLLQHG